MSVCPVVGYQDAHGVGHQIYIKDRKDHPLNEFDRDFAIPVVPKKEDEPPYQKGRQGDTKLVSLLRSALEAASDESGWGNLGTVGNNIVKQAPEFDPRNYGYSKLEALAKATNLFEFDKRLQGDGHSTVIYIRDKRKTMK